jgi:hypothetical protein
MRTDRRKNEMSTKAAKGNKRAFCVELKSREQLKRVSMPDGSGDRLLIEGFLGELEEIALIEGIMLEVRGANGVLRIDLPEEELKMALQKGNRQEKEGDGCRGEARR